jgi:hypothetical protein
MQKRYLSGRNVRMPSTVSAVHNIERQAGGSRNNCLSPLDAPTEPQHGIAGPRYNICGANQNPYNCRCFWSPVGAVSPQDLPSNAMAIEPFTN